MKIVHLDPDDMDSPASGGGPIRTFEIYRRLADRHDITVITPSFPGCKKEQIKEGIRYIRIGGRWGNHNSTYYFSYYLSAPFAARRFAHDLLVEDLMPPTAATITPIINSGKIVASVQWFFAKEWAEQFKIPFHWYQPFGLKFYRNFIVLTDDMKSKVLSYNPRANVVVIPNGLNEISFRQVSKPEDFILYLGRIENDQKGVGLLVEAFSKIASKTKAKLVIAGDGIDFQKTKEVIKNLGIMDRVVFEGKVGMERKLELLSKCLFVCVPSKYETFCMVALEAFAAAKTVVAFDIPHLDVVKEDFAVRIKAFDIDAYAQAMLRRLNAFSETQAMGERAKQYAQNLTWDKMALLQEEYYKGVLSN